MANKQNYEKPDLLSFRSCAQNVFMSSSTFNNQVLGEDNDDLLNEWTEI